MAEAAMHSVVPLPGRLEPWMRRVLADQAAAQSLIAAHGSPVNLINPDLLANHATELIDAAARHQVQLRVYFARKANKALALVDAALAAGHGVDVASERELEQVLSRPGLTDPHRVILSAAVKPRALLDRCTQSGVLISVDNDDEHRELVAAAQHAARPISVALRLAAHHRSVGYSRFGRTSDELRPVVATQAWWQSARLAGIHFHLHGYSVQDRIAALVEALDLAQYAVEHGHAPEFIDIGGGIPMRYLDSPEPFDDFMTRHRGGEDLTWRGRELDSVYPVWQEPVRGEWLSQLLSARPDGSRSLADRINELGLRLHAEPGRALLDGCGITLARVEFRKRDQHGRLLIGLAMNRTQCRSAADDFLVDPVLIAHPSNDRTEPAEGYLVGAYCIEAELLTWRRMVFTDGVAVGDMVAFINTGGYQMHILESASHQIRLARNLVADDGSWRLDDIDAPSSVS